jgi:hypothetical protein
MPQVQTNVNVPFATIFAAFIIAFVTAVGLGAFQGFIGMIIWNNIHLGPTVNFWQAWGLFIIIRMALSTTVKTTTEK